MQYDITLQNELGEKIWIGEYCSYDVPILVEDLLKLSHRYGFGWAIIIEPTIHDEEDEEK